MELFRIKRDIPFMRNALIFNVISAVTFVAAVFFLFTRGLHLSVEFTGGTSMEVSYSQAADTTKIREKIQSIGISEVVVQAFGKAQDVVIRMPLPKVAEGVAKPSEKELNAMITAQNERVMPALKAAHPDVKLQRTALVGAQVGDEMMHDGLLA